MKRPLVVFALLFYLGLFTASAIRAAFLPAYILALIFFLLALLSLKKGVRFDIFLCAFVFFFGAGLYKNSQTLPRRHILRFVSYKNNYPLTIKGIVDNRPFLANNTESFIFKVKEIRLNNRKYNACGNILVNMRHNKDNARIGNLRYGEELILTGNPRLPFRFGRVGRGIFCVMNVRTAGSVVRSGKSRGCALKRLSFWLRDRIEARIFKRVSFPAAGVMDAMILGEKRNVPVLINDSMMKSGTVHILVVSGFNVALVAFIVILSLRLVRIPRRARFFIACPLIIIYCLMTGASTPVVRATVMAILMMFAALIKREADIYNTLALAAIFILAVDPSQLFDIGFQLSFASVISIAYFYPRLRSFVPEGIFKIRFIRFLLEGCLVSFSAWLGTAGFIAYYFRIISPVTVLANIFIVPLASLITLCGFSLILMEFACPFFAPLFAYSNEFIIAFLLNINATLIKLPCAYFSLS